ncbi:MAG: transporter substrate-binding domain-containing protein [Alphaproteobacteria bacterium]|nr:transporter substrate-binding domain-containing protein [Alphaproteobacteria bacterium]
MNKREFLQMMGAGAVAGTAGAWMAGSMAESGTAPAESKSRNKETSYERIIRRGKIRCAWATYEPATIVDPLTRKMSGIYYEITNLVGDYLGFPVEWTEEVGWGEIIQGFKTGRYELFGSSLFPTPQRSVAANFSTAPYFSPYYAYVRADDKRFAAYEELNKPAVRISVQDGDVNDSIVRVSFPHAKKVSLPQMVQDKQRYYDVLMNKADVAFAEPVIMETFLKAHPGTLKRITDPRPLRVFPATLMFNDDDWRLKKMFDTAMFELYNAGIVHKLIEKYTGRTDLFLMPNDPYKG